MRILMTGSTGFLGSSLIPVLKAGGHDVTRLVREEPRPGSRDLHWDPARGIMPEFPGGVEAVIHLAGENIASGRWTAKRKALIRASRVDGTQLLSELLARAAEPPRILLSASAVGYYGNRGAETLTEQSSWGSGFLAEVCGEWEAATAPAAHAGIRVVILRNGVVLSAKGGMLAKILPVFRMGLGGPMGSGGHYMSWIALSDFIGVVQHCLGNSALNGPVVAAAPGPVTNREFVRILASVLRRPARLAMPAWGARLAFGEMATEVLLASQRVQPKRLVETGYSFRWPQLDAALRHLLA
jgi:uncharacterized protein